MPFIRACSSLSEYRSLLLLRPRLSKLWEVGVGTLAKRLPRMLPRPPTNNNPPTHIQTNLPICLPFPTFLFFFLFFVLILCHSSHHDQLTSPLNSSHLFLPLGTFRANSFPRFSTSQVLTTKTLDSLEGSWKENQSRCGVLHRTWLYCILG